MAGAGRRYRVLSALPTSPRFGPAPRCCPCRWTSAVGSCLCDLCRVENATSGLGEREPGTLDHRAKRHLYLCRRIFADKLLGCRFRRQQGDQNDQDIRTIRTSPSLRGFAGFQLLRRCRPGVALAVPLESPVILRRDPRDRCSHVSPAERGRAFQGGGPDGVGRTTRGQADRWRANGLRRPRNGSAQASGPARALRPRRTRRAPGRALPSGRSPSTTSCGSPESSTRTPWVPRPTSSRSSSQRSGSFRSRTSSGEAEPLMAA